MGTKIVKENNLVVLLIIKLPALFFTKMSASHIGRADWFSLPY